MPTNYTYQSCITAFAAGGKVVVIQPTSTQQQITLADSFSAYAKRLMMRNILAKKDDSPANGGGGVDDGSNVPPNGADYISITTDN